MERRTLRHGHAEILLPMIERVMAEARLRPASLDWVAAAVGPGGFTGIRVGLAAAHGIALAVAARSIGVSSFAAVAAGAAVRERDIGDRPALLVALDSRRDDLYVQLFAVASPGMPLAAPQSILPERLADHIAGLMTDGGNLLIAGDAADAAAAALGSHRSVSVVAASAPDASGVAAAALGRLRSGEPAPALCPLYLRPPDVSLPQRREPPSNGRLRVIRAVTALAPGAALPLSIMHRACFPEEPWDAAVLQRLLALSGVFGHLAWQDDATPAGFVLARDLGDEVEVLSIGVIPGCRRQGVGRALLDAVVAAGRRRGLGSVVLEVAEANDAARRLYAAAGFLQVGRRPRYYRHAGRSDDGLILRRAITGAASGQ
jgi:tRNA threonylcarbamoyl adenosine modification protein YeaZ